MRRPAKKGDPLLAHLTSDTFNELIRSVQQPTTPLPRKPHDDNTLVKAVYAGEDEDGLLLFEPVVIIGQRLTVATTLPDTSMMDMVLEVVKMSEATTEGDEELPIGPVAVTQQYIKGDTIGMVAISGNSWVRANASINTGKKVYWTNTVGDKVAGRTVSKTESGHGLCIITVPTGTGGLWYSNIIITQFEAGGGCANPVNDLRVDPGRQLVLIRCDGTEEVWHTGSACS